MKILLYAVFILSIAILGEVRGSNDGLRSPGIVTEGLSQNRTRVAVARKMNQIIHESVKSGENRPLANSKDSHLEEAEDSDSANDRRVVESRDTSEASKAVNESSIDQMLESEAENGEKQRIEPHIPLKSSTASNVETQPENSAEKSPTTDETTGAMTTSTAFSDLEDKSAHVGVSNATGRIESESEDIPIVKSGADSSSTTTNGSVNEEGTGSTDSTDGKRTQNIIEAETEDSNPDTVVKDTEVIFKSKAKLEDLGDEATTQAASTEEHDESLRNATINSNQVTGDTAGSSESVESDDSADYVAETLDSEAKKAKQSSLNARETAQTESGKQGEVDEPVDNDVDSDDEKISVSNFTSNVRENSTDHMDSEEDTSEEEKEALIPKSMEKLELERSEAEQASGSGNNQSERAVRAVIKEQFPDDSPLDSFEDSVTQNGDEEQSSLSEGPMPDQGTTKASKLVLDGNDLNGEGDDATADVTLDNQSNAAGPEISKREQAGSATARSENEGGASIETDAEEGIVTSPKSKQDDTVLAIGTGKEKLPKTTDMEDENYEHSTTLNPSSSIKKPADQVSREDSLSQKHSDVFTGGNDETDSTDNEPQGKQIESESKHEKTAAESNDAQTKVGSSLKIGGDENAKTSPSSPNKSIIPSPPSSKTKIKILPIHPSEPESGSPPSLSTGTGILTGQHRLSSTLPNPNPNINPDPKISHDSSTFPIQSSNEPLPTKPASQLQHALPRQAPAGSDLASTSGSPHHNTDSNQPFLVEVDPASDELIQGQVPNSMSRSAASLRVDSPETDFETGPRSRYGITGKEAPKWTPVRNAAQRSAKFKSMFAMVVFLACILGVCFYFYYQSTTTFMPAAENQMHDRVSSRPGRRRKNGGKDN